MSTENEEKYRIEVGNGCSWSKILLITNYVCPHCKDMHHQFIEDLTPFVPYHPKNVRLPDNVTSVTYPIVCPDCLGFIPEIIRFLKKIKKKLRRYKR